MRGRAKRKRDRIEVRPNRQITSAFGTALYGGALALFACWPAVPVLAILHAYGTPVGQDIRIARAGETLLYGLLAAMFLISIVVRGMGKVVLKSRYVGWPWLVALGVTIGIGMAIFTVQMNAAISGVHPGSANSNGDVLALFGFWLLTVGNAVATISNEASDRIAAWVEPKFIEGAEASKPSSGPRS